MIWVKVLALCPDKISARDDKTDLKSASPRRKLMYLDQYVVASLVLVAVMIVASVWAIGKVKKVINEDAAKAGK
jgi:hypothetical protein